MPPKDKRVFIMPRDTAKMPRNPAEDALYRLTLAGDLFQEQVLARLDPTDRGMLRLVNRDLRFTVQSRTIRHPWTFKVSDFVGSVERFKWALKNKIVRQAPLNILVKAIIKGGNLDVLKRAIKNPNRLVGHGAQYAPGFEFIRHEEIWTAAELGQTHIFEWYMDQPKLHDGIRAWGRALQFAAMGGHLDILKVFKARADKYPDDDVWNIKWDDVRRTAFLEGNVEMFEWVIAHGTCEQDTRTFLEYDYNMGFKLAVRSRLEMLQWYMARLEVENFPDIINHNKNFCLNTKRAAQCGHLEMLKWMAENGYKFAADALTEAAKGGHLECVVYLRERGCKMTPNVSKVTVNFAQIHVLRWAIENSCKWNPQWTLDQLERIDDPHGTYVGRLHAYNMRKGTVHENFGADFQWVIQRAHQKITDDKLAAEEKQRRKDDKQRRAAKKRKAN
jgi:hypothetical protein